MTDDFDDRPNVYQLSDRVLELNHEVLALRRERGRLRKALDRLERCIKFKQADGSVSKITNWYSAALALQEIREELKGESG